MYNHAKFFHRETIPSRDWKQLPESKWPQEWKTIFYKTYKHAERIALPDPECIDASLQDALLARASAKSFAGGSTLDIASVSNLIRYSFGLIDSERSNENVRRVYPSAGSRYPLEVYPVVQNVTGLQKGIYHYNLQEHALEAIRPAQFVDEVQESLMFDWMREADMFLVVSSVLERAMHKYRDRGYRHILQEVGAVMQNVYLVSSALDLRVTAVGGFNDRTVDEIFDFDGIEETIITLLALGGSSKHPTDVV